MPAKTATSRSGAKRRPGVRLRRIVRPRASRRGRSRLPKSLARLWQTEIVRIVDLVPSASFDAYLATTIRGISPFYSRAHVSLGSVPLDAVRPVSRVTETDRIKRAKRLLRLLRKKGYTYFEPCLVRYFGEVDYRLVLPPVVERTRRSYVVVDGVHRLATLAERSRPPTEVLVIVVSDSRMPPPAAVPAAFDKVRQMDYDPGRKFKFRRLRPDLFRPTGAVLGGAAFRFATPEKFIAACSEPRPGSERYA
jgi:hypothetical protein